MLRTETNGGVLIVIPAVKRCRIFVNSACCFSTGSDKLADLLDWEVPHLLLGIQCREKFLNIRDKLTILGYE